MSNVPHVASDTWQCCVLYGILEKKPHGLGVFGLYFKRCLFSTGGPGDQFLEGFSFVHPVKPVLLWKLDVWMLELLKM